MGDLDQRITGFDLWLLKLPVISRRDHGIGAVEGACEIVVLRLTAEGGETGYGEASPWSVFTGSAEAAFAALDRYIRPHVVGARVGDIAGIMAKAARAVAHATEAKAALEAALLDLAGRIAAMPAHAFLGGKCRDEVRLSVSLANPDFAEDIALLDRLTADGVGVVKLKTGFSGQDFDMMRMEKIRTDYPQMDLRIDYNQGLAPAEAASRVIEAARTFRPTFIEQPVRADQFTLMRRIREAIDTPLLADESVFGPEDLMRAAREEICDGVSIKIMKSGGLSRAKLTAEAAAAAGLSAYGGDMFEAGLAHLAGLHMIAATPAITLGCEFYQATYYLQEDILAAPFPVSDGVVHVPTGPGLGLSPDPDKIASYAAAQA